ncbi:hypothetical protein [uncultured Draconibacterium sp.]|uniref:hypothetical protein n=1 Tax=uncultured Draconibacterium sp. TaxID=1573823 RepID=UPI0025EB55F0|nr:hypothetical protein [uncultured Draconibacterium sp.]
MKLNLTGHKCPTCKTAISLKLFRNREKIIECKQCKSLLVETPKSRLISSAALVIGFFAAVGVSLVADNFWVGFLLILGTFSLSQALIKLSVAKRDLKIRDKITKRISYIQKSD